MCANPKKSILGLDVGDVSVGIAVYDSEVGIPRPLCTIARAQKVAEQRVLELIKEYGITEVVIGFPLSDIGERTLQCDSVEQFCDRLKKRASVEFAYVDEYSSTEDAIERLRAKGMSEREAKKSGALDALSAAIILEYFLKR